MKIQTLDADCINRLNERLRDEYIAHYFYKSATNHCKAWGYSGGESYFANEAEQELTHAKKIESFLCDWNTVPTLSDIPQPETFTSLPDVIEKAYKLEFDLLTSYEKDVAETIEDDVTVFTFLQQFLVIQNESVGDYATLLNKLDLVGTEKLSLFYFDKEVLGS